MSTYIINPDIAATVQRVIAQALDLETEDVQLSQFLMQDLGAESLDFLEISFELERQYSIQFPRQNILQIATAHFGNESVVKKGVVTELGVKILLQLMPELDSKYIHNSLKVHEVNRLISGNTIVLLTQKLIAAKIEGEKFPRSGETIILDEILKINYP